MDINTYNTFTQSLFANLRRDHRVLGLVAVGSMAGTLTQPDEWSDHDFLAATAPGAEEEYRTSTHWLPEYRPIVLHLRETAHGVKVLYDDGHLLEYAFFNAEDFHLVKINSYRILIDRGGFRELVENAVAETRAAVAQKPQSDEYLFGQFITHLLVGAGRHARGERLSGAQFVKHYAFNDLLPLLARHLPLEGEAVLDNIEPTRRFERAYPRLGAELNAALSLEAPGAALALLALAERELSARLAVFSTTAVTAVRKVIESAMRPEREK